MSKERDIYMIRTEKINQLSLIEMESLISILERQILFWKNCNNIMNSNSNINNIMNSNSNIIENLNLGELEAKTILNQMIQLKTILNKEIFKLEKESKLEKKSKLE